MNTHEFISGFFLKNKASFSQKNIIHKYVPPHIFIESTAPIPRPRNVPWPIPPPGSVPLRGFPCHWPDLWCSQPRCISIGLECWKLLGDRKWEILVQKKNWEPIFSFFFSIPWLRTSIFLRWKFWVSQFETNLNEGRSDFFPFKVMFLQHDTKLKVCWIMQCKFHVVSQREQRFIIRETGLLTYVPGWYGLDMSWLP